MGCACEASAHTGSSNASANTGAAASLVGGASLVAGGSLFTAVEPMPVDMEPQDTSVVALLVDQADGVGTVVHAGGSVS